MNKLVKKINKSINTNINSIGKEEENKINNKFYKKVSITKKNNERDTRQKRLDTEDSFLRPGQNNDDLNNRINSFLDFSVLNHHVLDPFTGFPADTGLSAVTILSDSSLWGDALSTACLLLGVDKGLALIDSIPEAEALFVLTDGTVRTTADFPEA